MSAIGSNAPPAINSDSDTDTEDYHMFPELTRRVEEEVPTKAECLEEIYAGDFPPPQDDLLIENNPPSLTRQDALSDFSKFTEKLEKHTESNSEDISDID